MGQPHVEVPAIRSYNLGHCGDEAGCLGEVRDQVTSMQWL